MKSSWPITRDALAAHYNGLVKQHGAYSPKSSGYADPETQEIRYTIASQAITQHTASILDVGCGLGFFRDHLATIHDHLQYTGVDISPDAIAAAKFRRPWLNFFKADIACEYLGCQFDVVVGIIIFVTIGEWTEDICRTLIKRMYDLSIRSTMFSAKRDCGLSEEKMIAIAKSLTPYVAVMGNYLGELEYSVFMFHEESLVPESLRKYLI